MVEHDTIQTTGEKNNDIETAEYDSSGNVTLYRTWESERIDPDGFYINEGERDELAALLSTDSGKKSTASSSSADQNRSDSGSDDGDNDRNEDDDELTFDGSYYRHEWSSGDIEMSVESDDPSFVKMVLEDKYD